MAGIFIASSEEGRVYAEAVVQILAGRGETVRPWWSDKSFPVGQSLIESLIEIVDTVDAALIIATPDDHVIRRGSTTYTPTHNIILEYGLLAGRHGRNNIAILEVGEPSLPSDLNGLRNIKVRSREDGEDAALYRDIELKDKVLSWLQEIEASSSDGARISRLVSRLAPGLKQSARINLKAKILRAQLDVNALPKQPPNVIEHLLLKYTNFTKLGESAGYYFQSTLDSYLNLADIPAGSGDERALAGHLARYVAELSVSQRVRPTLLAVSKTATYGILHEAATLLPYPVVRVSPVGPSRARPVEGFYERGDRAVLLHDVALTGHHLVDCIIALRSVGIRCNNLIALTRHQAGSRQMNALMKENQITVNVASAFLPERERVICGDLTLDESEDAPLECVLCDVIADRDSAPIRKFITREELHNEVLLENSDFAVIADVAPLAPGHSLIITKRHLLAMSKLSAEGMSALDALRKGLASRLRSLYSKPVIAFEHGLCNRALSPSCGIDHAHLHAVPTELDIGDLVRHDFEVTELDSIAQLPKLSGGRNEYLMYINDNERMVIAFPPQTSSQYFRRRLAESLGRRMWNWQDEVMLGANSDSKQWILDLHRSWLGEGLQQTHSEFYHG
jgi:diadenosine tetraphosphate (Ap4A) HIT family hydrolase